MRDTGCVFFDCDGTLVDSEVLCSRGYVQMFAHYGITLTLEEVFKKYKGVKLYDIIEQVGRQYPLHAPVAEMEARYRQEVARLFDQELVAIEGARELLAQIEVPVCVVSNGPVSKMQHSLGLTGLLPFFTDGDRHRLFSGYDVQRWKPDPALLHHAAREMDVPMARCILVEDSVAGAQAGIAADIPVFYYCADPHNPVIDHPLVTPFRDMRALPGLWREQGYRLTR
ncbi:MAG: 6-phosphogluconate phosphatase [Yersiniaceae bacterium]|nr:6-phosphogluconate phosphatase [Yersiniaceae bacterium]